MLPLAEHLKKSRQQQKLLCVDPCSALEASNQQIHAANNKITEGINIPSRAGVTNPTHPGAMDATGKMGDTRSTRACKQVSGSRSLNSGCQGVEGVEGLGDGGDKPPAEEEIVNKRFGYSLPHERFQRLAHDGSHFVPYFVGVCVWRRGDLQP
jgi:hypothetical protein